MSCVEGVQDTQLVKVELRLDDHRSELFMVAGEMRELAQEALAAILERAKELLEGRPLIRLTYMDDDGDACTLTTSSLSDALSFTTPGEGEDRVLQVAVLAEPAALAQSAGAAAAPELAAPDAPPSEALAGEATAPEEAPEAAPAAAGEPDPTEVPEDPPAEAAPAPGAVGTQDLEVHMTVACDGCDQAPILGKRFKCLECHDYDLCERCFEKNRAGLTVHEHKQWARIQADCHVPVSGDVRNAELVACYAGSASEGLPAHVGFICDGCEANPIVGSRFRCATVPDYDLCAACYARRAEVSPHADQPFEELVVAPVVIRGVQPSAKQVEAEAEAPAEPDCVPLLQPDSDSTCTEEPSSPAVEASEACEATPQLSAPEAAAALRSLVLGMDDDLCLLALKALMESPDEQLRAIAAAAAAEAPALQAAASEEPAEKAEETAEGPGAALAEAAPEAEAPLESAAEAETEAEAEVASEAEAEGLESASVQTQAAEEVEAEAEAEAEAQAEAEADTPLEAKEPVEERLAKEAAERQAKEEADRKKREEEEKAKDAVAQRARAFREALEKKRQDEEEKRRAAKAAQEPAKPAPEVTAEAAPSAGGSSDKAGAEAAAAGEIEGELGSRDGVPGADQQKPAELRPSARAIGSSELILGVEAIEDTSARGDITDKSRDLLLHFPSASQAYCCGRVALPASEGAAAVPAEAACVVVNDGAAPWPEATFLALLGSPTSLTLSPPALGPVQPGTAAELKIDLSLPQRAEPGASCYTWSLVDASTNELFGPLIVFDVTYTQGQ